MKSRTLWLVIRSVTGGRLKFRPACFRAICSVRSRSIRTSLRARAMEEHLYIVTYDIGDPKRWRVVYGLMNGYGEWVQLSVFQCRLSRQRHAEMIATLDEVIDDAED